MLRCLVSALSGLALVALLLPTAASANTLTQNTSWTINRTGATQKYRVVAYGDSIYAGYTGSLSSVAKRAGPLVDGEYLAQKWNANIEVIRRTKSGAKADDIYNNKIVAERSYMQATSTRVVQFEMCGNDYLQARSNLNGQSGTCNFAVLDTALANCASYTERAMQAINTYATTAKVKVVMNLYYPGYAADNTTLACKDASGASVNKQQKFMPYIARSNWRTCNLAERYGFKCADMFAEWMGADYDSNGDGQVDSDALRYHSGETEDAYVQRVTVALRSTVRDANTHFANASTSFDYLQSDDTHPTFYGGTIGVSIFTGSGSGSGAPDFADSTVVGGKNPQWNTRGHERMGWASSLFDPATP
ncbi:SGNH/GDSL hydrolase family protein [Aggregicoccus sp. 17bor-14]|uniref:SGNH/GDSL hydrolase family protein n=1 Tax=Myxococcaceae TaxID=31 RepID=UPI00129CE704|nr:MULTISPECIES: SGNH/GDSL hydrolase family protein [Myxococcaceae]MBF5046150.1 SGNH/GDSL hydrolase family protein [Simulacricoccus sp. 17bor-14]MRI91876.1 SGNH/GDSL hydrolase family protein [Aggregicoccus sp. 17bor-14]